ncbi:MAG: heavy metal translocating P-type ATPase [Acidimicrobiia bacterium]|nr:heavy metal translocating P-type ATPase [Acidimicrobiia bacterium]
MECFPPRERSTDGTEEGQERKLFGFLPLADVLRVLFVGLAALAVWLELWEPFEQVSVIGVVGVVVGAWPFLKEAVENLMERRMTMELSMTIAIVAAALIGEFITALIIAIFVLIAEILEELTVDRGRQAIRELLDVLPNRVSVRRNGRIETIPVEELELGETVLVDPGGNIAMDGVVVDGHSFVNQASITGESMPVEKVEGAEVFAGTVNQSGALEVRVEAIGRDTSFGKIIDAVEKAERSRAPVQRLADRLAGYLVYFALGSALITFLVTRDVRSTISVVIVAGACGIAAGTPLAILGGIGRSARLGAIVKGGVHLENLGLVDTVVLDKTGTLTFGTPMLQALIPADGVSESELLTLAASAELRSEHPLGKAIVSEAKDSDHRPVEPTMFKYEPGQGIDAHVDGVRVLVGNRTHLTQHGVEVPSGFSSGLPEGSSDILVARGSEYLGAIAVADQVRPEAREVVAAMRGMGLRVLLLTGDTRSVADAVARQLDVEEVEAELLPGDKLEKVKSLVSSGRKVAMVGDGVNDAPALTEATVGVAMGSGTDVARESGDVVLLGNDLASFGDTIALAHRTRGIIWQNFGGTIGVDLLGIGLAAFGMLGPLMAAFIHVASELAFILNSARLLPGRRSQWTDTTVAEVPAQVEEIAERASA